MTSCRPWLIATMLIALVGCPKVELQKPYPTPQCDMSLDLVASQAPPEAAPKWEFRLTNHSDEVWELTTALWGSLTWRDGDSLVSSSLHQSGVMGIVYGPIPLDMEPTPNPLFVVQPGETLPIGLEWPVSPPFSLDRNVPGVPTSSSLASAAKKEWYLHVNGSASWHTSSGEFGYCQYGYRFWATVCRECGVAARAERVRE